MPQITIRLAATVGAKLADADVRFTQDDGAILAGLTLTGFSIWPSRYDGAARVQIPTRQYYQGRELRKYAILRDSHDQPIDQDHPLIAVILREYDRATTPAELPTPEPEPAPILAPIAQTYPQPVSLYDIAREQDRAANLDTVPDFRRFTPAAPQVDPAPLQVSHTAPQVTPATVLPFVRRYTAPTPTNRPTTTPKPATTPAGTVIKF